PHPPGLALGVHPAPRGPAGRRGRRDRPGRAARALAGSLPRHRRVPTVRVPLQHRCAAVPRRPRAHRRWTRSRSVAAPAHNPVPRRHSAVSARQRVCHDRDHAVRLLAMSTHTARDERRARLLLAGVIAVGVLIRLVAVRAQGFTTDVGTFQAWAERLAQIGPGRFYEPGYFSDYPPAFLYVLWLLGAMFDGEFLRLAVKAISIPADIAIAILAARTLWRTTGRASGIAAAAIWSLQPGPIFAGPYWGQVDAVGTLPLFGALLAAGSRRWWLAGVLAALAALVKPQFGIGLVVIGMAAAFEFIREARLRPAAEAIGAAVVTAYVVSVPFWGADPVRIAGELVRLVRTASETYPYTS